MKAFLILEDGHVFTGTSIGSAREVIDIEKSSHNVMDVTVYKLSLTLP